MDRIDFRGYSFRVFRVFRGHNPPLHSGCAVLSQRAKILDQVVDMRVERDSQVLAAEVDRAAVDLGGESVEVHGNSGSFKLFAMSVEKRNGEGIMENVTVGAFHCGDNRHQNH